MSKMLSKKENLELECIKETSERVIKSQELFVWGCVQSELTFLMLKRVL